MDCEGTELTPEQVVCAKPMVKEEQLHGIDKFPGDTVANCPTISWEVNVPGRNLSLWNLGSVASSKLAIQRDKKRGKREGDRETER